jgi:hemolysin activation/secretion protein
MFLKTIKTRKNCPPGRRWWPVLCLLSALGCQAPEVVSPALAAQSVASAASPNGSATAPALNVPATVETNATPHFNVRAYVIEGKLPLSPDITTPLFSKYTGTNISLDQLAQAASDLQSAYDQRGYSTVSIVISPQRIANGIVTLNVFQGAFSQIVIDGQRYSGSGSITLAAYQPPVPGTEKSEAATPAATTTAVVATPVAPPAVYHPPVPATPEELAKAREALVQKMAELSSAANDRRIHVVATNAGPRFEVEKYHIMGNSVLSPAALARTMTNIDGAYGTNVSLDGIRAAVTELQKAYRARGYVTVAVGLPQQTLTNATVKIQVTEGRLADIKVKGNFYFSSNNVMRALPSLHTNMILNAKVFQAELNRANANQDRQIYPVVSPGPEPGTSDLTLNVKDQLPLHAKVELNNESSPGTPDLRLNSSFVYNNLWDLEHSIGAQYSFSPELYKSGNQWDFYDQPLVANYSAYYRMPLGNPVAIEDVVEANPGSFGYDEATRKFNLPPPSGQAEMNFFASRSTIDTGLQDLGSTVLADEPGVRTITENNVQEDLTVNQDIGFRLNTPLAAAGNFSSDFSGGLDFKTYEVTSAKTNNFTDAEITLDQQGLPNPPIYSRIASPVPLTDSRIEYLPLSLHGDANWHDSAGTLAMGLGLSVDTWFSSTTTAGTNAPTRGVKSLQDITGSTESTGHWVILNPSMSHDFTFRPDWITTLRADGQWASEPLISNEQFGIGGVNSVRGYREGEVFGDTGWHVSLEQQTPPVVVGMAYGNTPLTLRGSVYTDYGRVFLLDPEGRQGSTPLSDVGFGGVASVGSHWQAHFLFSLPLLDSPTIQAYHPFFNFALTAQF